MQTNHDSSLISPDSNSTALASETEEAVRRDLASVLQQVDVVFKEKFEIEGINLCDLSAEEFSQLNEKIATNVLAWKATTFEEYKEEKEMDVSLLKLQDEFNQYIKGDGPKWILSVIGVKETPSLLHFINTQLKLGRLFSLRLFQRLSKEAINSILQACQQSTLDSIWFSKDQNLSDGEVKILLKCIHRGQLKQMFHVNGEDLSNETVDKCIEFEQVVVNCPYFDLRTVIETDINSLDVDDSSVKYNLTRVRFKHSEHYRTDDIKKLAQKLIEHTGRKICIHLDSKFVQPEWGPFFTRILSSTVDVTELVIQMAEISDIILSQLMASLKLNTSLKNVTLEVEQEDVVREVLQALSLHPSLTQLIVYSYSDFNSQGPALKQLLLQTKHLQALYLAGSRMNEEALLELAEGLSGNNTLTTLYLGDRNLSQKGLAQFLSALKKNTSVVKMDISLPEKFKKENNNLKSIVIRNAGLAQQQRQVYVEMAIALAQAAHQGHPIFTLLVSTKVLSFLRPTPNLASLGAVHRCTSLIFSNLKKPRKWNTKCIGNDNACYSKGGNKITIFKKWTELQAPTTELKLIDDRHLKPGK